MRKIKIKTAACIFVFCIVVSIAFSAMLIAFQKDSIEKLSQSSTGIYFLTENDVQNYVSNGSININSWNFTSTSDYNTTLFGRLYQNVLPLAIFFFLFLFLSAFLLLLTVRILQNKENKKIADELINLKNGEEISTDNPMLGKIYSELEKKFDANLSDYKFGSYKCSKSRKFLSKP